MGIMNQMEGVNLHEKKGGKFKFRMYMTQGMKRASIETLDLKPRPINILRRAGYNTVGEVVDAVSCGIELKRLRNCGEKSAREIMEQLFLYQYNSLPPEERDGYLAEVVLLNRK